jgi:hypothetical protein
MEVGLLEMKRKEEEEKAAKKAKSDKFPPDNEDCEGECNVFACAVCCDFYFENALEDHPWFTKMGLAQPGHWMGTDPWRYEDYVTEEAWTGTVGWTGNYGRKHPVACLLMEAYDFVCLAEPPPDVENVENMKNMKNALQNVRMPAIADVMAVRARAGCRVRPLCGGRRWASACLGPWNHSVCFGPRGSCERCAAVAWKSKARERVQEAAELRLHGEMKAEWRRWQDSWGVRAEGGTPAAASGPLLGTSAFFVRTTGVAGWPEGLGAAAAVGAGARQHDADGPRRRLDGQALEEGVDGCAGTAGGAAQHVGLVAKQ